MGIEDKLRETAKGLGKKIADVAKDEGKQLLGDLKGKLVDEVEGLKQKATKAASDLVEEQKNKLTEKASDLLKKR